MTPEQERVLRTTYKQITMELCWYDTVLMQKWIVQDGERFIVLQNETPPEGSVRMTEYGFNVGIEEFGANTSLLRRAIYIRTKVEWRRVPPYHEC